MFSASELTNAGIIASILIVQTPRFKSNRREQIRWCVAQICSLIDRPLLAAATDSMFEFFALVEAAGIEPCCSDNSNLIMAHDFGCYGMKNFELL